MIKQTTKTTVTKTVIKYEVAFPGEDQGARIRTVGYLDDNPFIRMSGKWLADAGFHIGDKFQVTVKENQLLLERLVESPDSQGSSRDGV